MDDERLDVADIGQVAAQTEGLDEGSPSLAAARHPESENQALVVGLMAAARASGSPAGTKVVSIPRRRKVTSRSVWVPPYKEAEATMWSPAPAKAVKHSVSAACPLAVATAPIPPSRLAIRSSKAATVGLEMRE